MEQKFYFFGELQRVIEECDLTLSEIKVYCKIANLPKGCYASYQSLADMVGISRRSAIRAIQKLSEIGLIEQIDGAWYLARGGVSDKNVTEVVTKMSPEECQKCHPASDKNVTLLTNIGVTSTGDTKKGSAKADVSSTPEKRNKNKLTEVLEKRSAEWRSLAATRALDEWVFYRKEIKKPLSSASLSKLLSKWAKNIPGFIEAVDHTIEMGWQGLRSPEQKPIYKTARERNQEQFEKEFAEYWRG